MATINFATRELAAKIVYFGATSAGCNTNLERLHALIPGRSKSALHKFGPRESDERSMYFDYLSLDPAPIDGFAQVVRVYSLPGGIGLQAHRDEVMRAVDGIVFVADARGDRNAANVDALLGLETLLTALALDMSALPIVLQVNHTDSPEARPVADVVFDLNPFGFPAIPAIARQDHGVLETHGELLRGMTERIRNAVIGQTPGLRLTAIHDPVRRTDTDVIQAHVDTIQERAEITPQIDDVAVELPDDVDDAAGLPAGPTIEVPFQPRELVGSHPVRILAAEIDADHVRVELLMERMGGAESRRLTVLLANRPTDTLPKRAASAPPPH
ncbi:MAG: hypothetical protein ABMB14_23095 [Myxococcota bacterium]